MLEIILQWFIFASALTTDVPSLPYCSENYQNGLVMVSTLDGKLSALNSNGSLVWDIEAGPGPLLLSNIHDLELTDNGWIRIIPSLTGILYTFDGSKIHPIPISAEELLKSSFLYSSDLVVAGGLEVKTYGVGFRTGTLFYECSSMKCLNNNNNDDDVLIIERSTRTIRAVEPRTGIEKWNFSVGMHNIKLPSVSCIDEHTMLDWNFTAIIPEGKLSVVIKHHGLENNWQYTFPSPIVRIWKWNGKDLSEVNVFTLQNTEIVTTLSPSLYLGMHQRQLYIHESESIQNKMQELFNMKSNSNSIVTEHTGLVTIPWKPIRASTNIIEDDATALSVLNGSDYVNGHGFYLYTEEGLKSRHNFFCSSNNSFIHNVTHHKSVEKMINFYTYLYSWWKETSLLILTVIIFHMLFKFWNHRNIQHQNQKEIIIIEKPVDAQITQLLEPKENFTSRFENDFETIRCLGKGGFGVVFEVKQKYDECRYAIKRITLPKEELSRDRVMREVKALAKLEHQNIVRYFGSWLEHPPIGWQQRHDEKWIKDQSSYVDDISTSDEKVKRSKSYSVCIDIPLRRNELDSSVSLLDEINNDEDSDDDSFIVFEKAEADLGEQTGKTSEGEDNDNCSKVVTDSVDSTDSNSYSKSVISSSGISNHLKKKIDWKKPGRKHYSWDITFNSALKSKQQKIPPIYLYIQMQLCKEQSLKEWLSLHNERDYNQVIIFFSQILDAVEYVHHQGLIHRDLKPSNIFFSLDGQIKVGDFGLVKDVEDAFDLEMIKKGTLSINRGHTVEVGTQLYMSPEQFKSRLYDNKVDIYSLGLIFFELLVPFSTEMERIKNLTDVKRHNFPKGFSEKFPHEYLLMQNMLCDDPSKRLAITDIKYRPPLHKDDSECSDNVYNKLTSSE